MTLYQYCLRNYETVGEIEIFHYSQFIKRGNLQEIYNDNTHYFMEKYTIVEVTEGTPVRIKVKLT